MEGDLVSVKSNLVKNISTHALTWRATVFVITNTIFPQDFYPRPHMEGDKNPGRSVPPGSDFYPRPHMEGDVQTKNKEVKIMIFLPTPSHGGRPGIPFGWAGGIHFYPRPHMEGDVVARGAVTASIDISTHALTWRATSAPNSNKLPNKFLPTPSHGGRQLVQNGGGET